MHNMSICLDEQSLEAALQGLMLLMLCMSYVQLSSNSMLLLEESMRFAGASQYLPMPWFVIPSEAFRASKDRNARLGYAQLQ